MKRDAQLTGAARRSRRIELEFAFASHEQARLTRLVNVQADRTTLGTLVPAQAARHPRGVHLAVQVCHAAAGVHSHVDDSADTLVRLSEFYTAAPEQTAQVGCLRDRKLLQGSYVRPAYMNLAVTICGVPTRSENRPSVGYDNRGAVGNQDHPRHTVSVRYPRSLLRVPIRQRTEGARLDGIENALNARERLSSQV